jgi:3-oxoacyl-[acyl-carrier protein] reductase
VVIVSSGAGVNPNGSPMSGGYAGTKRMQMFLAGYFQQAADARKLGIRFVALAPMQFLAGTRTGEAATAASRPARILGRPAV